MPELLAILGEKSEQDYQDKKFFAQLKGINLDESNPEKNKWEEIKARAFSGGQTSNPNDIVALQGIAAQKAGFGIGMGLEYEVVE